MGRGSIIWLRMRESKSPVVVARGIQPLRHQKSLEVQGRRRARQVEDHGICVRKATGVSAREEWWKGSYVAAELL